MKGWFGGVNMTVFWELQKWEINEPKKNASPMGEALPRTHILDQNQVTGNIHKGQISRTVALVGMRI
jgi:hypothetical protein